MQLKLHELDCIITYLTWANSLCNANPPYICGFKVSAETAS